MPTFPMPPAYSYELARSDRRGAVTLQKRVGRDDVERWAVYEDQNTCLVDPGYWSYESLPSNRTDEYLAKARHTLDGALDLWRRHLAVALGGGTWRDCVAHDIPARRCERLYDPWGLVALVGEQASRPKPGSWISPSTAELAMREDGPRDLREMALALDQDFRRSMALYGDDRIREGTRESVVAADDGFGSLAVDLVLDSIGRERFTPPFAAALSADLYALLASGEPFQAGLATLTVRNGLVLATVPERRPDLDLPRHPPKG